MAGTKGVSIRLGTEGKAQVKSDFAEMGESGKAAFKGIGDAANASDAQVARLTAGIEKANAAAIAADRDRARKAQALSNIIPQSNMQFATSVAAGTGYGAYAGSARDSATALKQLLAQQDAEQAKAAAILAILDPLAVAQERYNAELAAATALKEQGLLTDAQLIEYQTLIKARLDATTVSQEANGLAANGSRIAQMELMGSVRGMTDAVAAGQSPVRALSMEMGRLGEAAAFGGSSLGKLGAFLGSGWGIAVVSALAVFGPYVAKLIEGADGAKKLKAAQIDLSDVTDRHTASQKELNKAIDDYNEKQAKAVETTRLYVQEEINATNADLSAAEAKRKLLDGQLALAKDQTGVSATDKVARAAQIGAEYAADARIADNKAEIVKLQDEINNNLIQMGDLEAKALDPLEAVRQKYKDINAEIQSLVSHKNAGAYVDGVGAVGGTIANGRFTGQIPGVGAGSFVNMPLDQLTKIIGAAQAAALKAAKPVSEGSIIDRASAADLYAKANSYRGLSESANNGQLKDLLKQSGVNVDPKMTAWCAAFVNAVLATDGLHGTGSLSARSFLNYGEATSKPVPGDIIVSRRGTGNEGHVGFFQGIDAKGNILVLGGNTGNKVGTEAVAPKDVLARRHVTAGADDRAAREQQRLADQDVKRARDFAQASDELDAKQLQAMRDGMTNLDEIAQFQKDQVDVEAAKYDAAVEAKVKLGDLTRAQGNELEAKQAIVAQLDKEAIDRKAAADKLIDAGKLDDDLTSTKIEVLQSQEDIAKTAKGRRDLELQILDLEKQQAKAHYDQVIALGQLGQATDEQVKAAQAGLASLDAIYGAKTKGALQQTAGPLEAYADKLDQSKQQIYERVQGFATDELDNFRKGLDDAVEKATGIKDPFLLDAIDLLIEQVVIRPLADAMSKAASSGGGHGGLGAIISGIASVAGSFFGGGGGSGGTTLGSADFSGYNFGGHAVGTENFSGGMTWLAENGPELVNLPRGSKVTPAAETRRMMAGSNDNRPVQFLNFDFSGSVTTEQLMREAEARSRAEAQKAAQEGIANAIDLNRRTYGKLFSAAQ